MAYTKTAWENRNPQVPINDANLNKMEEGIRTAHVTADAAVVNNGTNLTAIQTNAGDIAQLQADTTSATINAAGITALEVYNTWRTVSTDTGFNAISAIDNVFCACSAIDGTSLDFTLPIDADLTSRIRVVDAGQDFSVRPVKFRNNTKKIMGLLEDFQFDVLNGSIELAWSGDTFGWVIVNKSI